MITWAIGGFIIACVVCLIGAGAFLGLHGNSERRITPI